MQLRGRLGRRRAVDDRLRVAVRQLPGGGDHRAPRPLAADLALLQLRHDRASTLCCNALSCTVLCSNI